MSDSSIAAAPSPSPFSSGGGFFPKATLIHIACEALLIGVVFFLLNRKIASQQADLIECAVRIAAQNKRMTELEDTVKDLSSKMSSISTTVASLTKQVTMASMPMAFPPMPAPSRMGMPSAMPFPMPGINRPASPVPDSNPVTPSNNIASNPSSSSSGSEPFRVQPFLGSPSSDAAPSSSHEIGRAHV